MVTEQPLIKGDGFHQESQREIRDTGFRMRHGWGVVQLVGHLTVNEAGVGSNPTAPANIVKPEVCDAGVRQSEIEATFHVV